jgi:hypothetical protein
VKTQVSPRPGIIDALTNGLIGAARRPWLILIPLIIDLTLWLAPPLSISDLLQRFLRGWEGLVRSVYTPAQLDLMADMLTTIREGMTLLGKQVNLLDVLAGSWFSAPSLMAVNQTTRLDFISQMILAPAGLILKLPRPVAAPWQAAPVEVSGLWAVMLIVVGLWLVAQVVAVFWLRWAEAGERGQAADLSASSAADGGWRGFPTQVAQLIAFCLTLGILVFLLQLPLGFAAALLTMSGNAIAVGMFALIGGITLWIMLWLMLSLYFTGEGLMFERQPVWRSMLQGAAMMRGNVLATLGLLALINLLLVGFRGVWGVIGQNPVGALLAIVGNAYLATAMLLAVFSFYRGLRQYWLTTQGAQAAAFKRTAHKDDSRTTNEDDKG